MATGIVIDNGSQNLRCGYIGEQIPNFVFPTVNGHSRYRGYYKYENEAIGDDAYRRADTMQLTCPIENGVINNWDGMEKIWHHAFHNQLGVDPAEHPVVMTDKIPFYPNYKSWYSPPANRDKMTKIMFETFEVPALYIGEQCVFALFSVGKISGITLDSGYQCTHCIPVNEGVVMDQKYIQSSDVGGQQITNHLESLLKEKLQFVKSYKRNQIAEDIKKKLCVSLPCLEVWSLTDELYADYFYSGYLREDKTQRVPMDVLSLCDEYVGAGDWYELPDKSRVYATTGKTADELRNEGRIYVPRKMKTDVVEYLFKPRLNGGWDESKIGIHQLCGNVIKKLKDEEDAKDLRDVLFFGGNALFKGISNRFEQEMKKMDGDVNVSTEPEEYQGNCVWIGASIFSSLSSFEEMWITKDDYNENGLRMHKPSFSLDKN